MDKILREELALVVGKSGSLLLGGYKSKVFKSLGSLGWSVNHMRLEATLSMFGASLRGLQWALKQRLSYFMFGVI